MAIPNHGSTYHGSTYHGPTYLVLLTMVLLTMALLTMALLTMAILLPWLYFYNGSTFTMAVLLLTIGLRVKLSWFVRRNNSTTLSN